MKIEINTTVEQDAALAELNLISNPESPRPTIEEFAASVLNDTLDEIVVRIKSRTLIQLQNKLQDSGSKLTAQDLEEVAAIVGKYDAPAPVEEPVEPAPGLLSKLTTAFTGMFK